MEKLKEIENEFGVEILYACEAGSRAWGFSNDESDWDIRFIYKRNVKDYLSLIKMKDVIEVTDRDNYLDFVGWDIKKALMLHFKSNPNLREWIKSDRIYLDIGVDLIFNNLGGFDRNILMNHYSSIAFSHWKKYCGDFIGKDNSKKYLYVLRCILSWNLLKKEICPPINIFDLLMCNESLISKDVKRSIMKLIEFHQSKSEINDSDIEVINSFIISSLNNMDHLEPSMVKDIQKYDEIFRELLLSF